MHAQGAGWAAGVRWGGRGRAWQEQGQGGLWGCREQLVDHEQGRQSGRNEVGATGGAWTGERLALIYLPQIPSADVGRTGPTEAHVEIGRQLRSPQCGPDRQKL